MTTETLYNELNYVNHSRENRMYYAQMVINDSSLIPKLIEILMLVDDKVSPRAAWVLEFACKDNLDIIIPYLDVFTQNMHRVKKEQAVRPVAKICEYLANAYFYKTENKVKESLTQTHKERIVEVAFEYMIGDYKVAPKAYSMTTLYLFGKEFDWIHPELAIILERDFHKESAAFKARARHVLKKLKP